MHVSPPFLILSSVLFPRLSLFSMFEFRLFSPKTICIPLFVEICIARSGAEIGLGNHQNHQGPVQWVQWVDPGLDRLRLPYSAHVQPAVGARLQVVSTILAYHVPTVKPSYLFSPFTPPSLPSLLHSLDTTSLPSYPSSSFSRLYEIRAVVDEDVMYNISLDC